MISDGVLVYINEYYYIYFRCLFHLVDRQLNGKHIVERKSYGELSFTSLFDNVSFNISSLISTNFIYAIWTTRNDI